MTGCVHDPKLVLAPGRRGCSRAVNASGCLGSAKSMAPFTASKIGRTWLQKRARSVSASCSQSDPSDSLGNHQCQTGPTFAAACRTVNAEYLQSSLTAVYSRHLGGNGGHRLTHLHFLCSLSARLGVHAKARGKECHSGHRSAQAAKCYPACSALKPCKACTGFK